MRLTRYQLQWAKLRRIRRWFCAAYLSALPAEMLIGWPLDRLFHSTIPFVSIALISMTAFVILGLRIANWKCPRCHRPFFRNWIWTNGFSWRHVVCIHCGLPLYDPGEVEVPG